MNINLYALSLFLRKYLVSLWEKFMQAFKKAPEQSSNLNGISCFPLNHNQSGQILFLNLQSEKLFKNSFQFGYL